MAGSEPGGKTAIKLVALYKEPTDPAAFDRYYSDVHIPLVKKIPGVRRIEVARMLAGANGQSEYYLMAEVYYDNQAALEAAMASPEGQVVVADVARIPQSVVSVHLAEVV